METHLEPILECSEDQQQEIEGWELLLSGEELADSQHCAPSMVVISAI